MALYKTEVIRHAGPWRHLEEVEYTMLEWVAWYNSRRQITRLGYVSPAEYEEQCHLTQAAPAGVGALT
jgi:transposase InsO family protein